MPLQILNSQMDPSVNFAEEVSVLDNNFQSLSQIVIKLYPACFKLFSRIIVSS